MKKITLADMAKEVEFKFKTTDSLEDKIIAFEKNEREKAEAHAKKHPVKYRVFRFSDFNKKCEDKYGRSKNR